MELTTDGALQENKGLVYSEILQEEPSKIDTESKRNK